MVNLRVGPSLLVIILVLPLFFGVAAQPATANSCQRSYAESIQFHEDHWWIIVSRGEDAPAEVYQFTRDWTVVDRHSIDFDGNQTSNFTRIRGTGLSSIAPRPDGGWWVLGRRGNVYGFTDNWQYTGETRQLSGAGIDTYDIERLNGSWWLLGRDGVWQYTDNWTAPRAKDIQSHTEFPTLGLAGSGQHIWAVDASGNGNVNRFTPRDGAANGPTHDRQRVLDWETSRPRDIEKGPDGRWVVLEGDGGVVEYTNYWQHTGTQREVTEAIGYCGMSAVGFIYIITAIPLTLSVLSGLFLVGYRHQTPKKKASLITGATGLAMATAYYFYLLPPPFSILYLPPDRIIAAMLALHGIGSLMLVRTAPDSTALRDRSMRELVAALRGPGLVVDAVAICLIQAPLLLVACMFLL